ncbi:4867_t:CDS:2, partial [Racocetra persica]
GGKKPKQKFFAKRKREGHNWGFLFSLAGVIACGRFGFAGGWVSSDQKETEFWDKIQNQDNTKLKENDD